MQTLVLFSDNDIYGYAIGLDSVSAARVADILHAIAHDPVNPTPVIASIHQPRSFLRFSSP